MLEENTGKQWWMGHKLRIRPERSRPYTSHEARAEHAKLASASARSDWEPVAQQHRDAEHWRI